MQDGSSTDAEEKALARALRYLGYRSRSEQEVRSRLARSGFAPGVVERTLEKLRSLNYVNDSTFARNWARLRFEARGFGPRRIEQELTSRGIAPALASEVVRELYSPADELKCAKSLFEKKFKAFDSSDPASIRRAAGFLRRRGFGDDVVFQVLRLRGEDS